MLCKVIPKLTVSTSRLTRTVSRYIGNPIVIIPSISDFRPALVYSGVYLQSHYPPPTYKPAVASKARRR